MELCLWLGLVITFRPLSDLPIQGRDSFSPTHGDLPEAEERGQTIRAMFCEVPRPAPIIPLPTTHLFLSLYRASYCWRHTGTFILFDNSTFAPNTPQRPMVRCPQTDRDKDHQHLDEELWQAEATDEHTRMIEDRQAADWGFTCYGYFSAESRAN